MADGEKKGDKFVCLFFRKGDKFFFSASHIWELNIILLGDVVQVLENKRLLAQEQLSVKGEACPGNVLVGNLPKMLVDQAQSFNYPALVEEGEN